MERFEGTKDAFEVALDGTLDVAIFNASLFSSVPITCDALGVVGDRIAVIDISANVLKQCGPKTRVIDAKQGLLCPGFTDSHCHFLDGGLRLLSVKLRDVTNKEEFALRIEEFVKTVAVSEWILGGDWDLHGYDDLPDRSWIDSVSPNNPVWVNRHDGHCALANSLALRIAGITKDTPDNAGGVIVRNLQGDPTGLLKDNAQNLVVPFLPKRSAKELDSALDAAMSHVASKGVTEVHTMITVDCANGLWPQNMGRDAENQNVDAAFEEVEVYRRADRSGSLRTRIRAALPLASWRKVLSEVNCSNDWLKVGSLKAMIDGSLGSHTAAFLEDYTDSPGYKVPFFFLFGKSTSFFAMRQMNPFDSNVLILTSRVTSFGMKFSSKI
jgi:predicted amidohydrolase YtcJ